MPWQRKPKEKSGDDARRFDEIVALMDHSARTSDRATIHRVLALLGQLEDPHHPRWGVIAALRHAVAQTPRDHPDWAEYATGLGLTLQERFNTTGDIAALKEAIGSYRHALAATPLDHPRVTGLLTNLGETLCFQFERIGDVAALEEAITVNRDAVQRTPPDHPDRVTPLYSLAFALDERFKRTGDMPSLREALTHAVRLSLRLRPTIPVGKDG